jgi:hypothetical protein
VVDEPPARAVVVLLLLATALFAASLPLAWHREPTAAATLSYRLVRGIDGASWLTVAAALCTGFAVHFARTPPRYLSRLLLPMLTFLIWLGMLTDYEDWQAKAASEGTSAYFGAGFYVALGGAAILVVAAVQTWRSSA